MVSYFWKWILNTAAVQQKNNIMLITMQYNAVTANVDYWESVFVQALNIDFTNKQQNKSRKM